MSVAVPVINYIDGATRRIYLLAGVDAFHWIDDIYREVLQMRATDVALQSWVPFLRADGNNPKGGGKYTPRYVTLLDGCRVIPFDENILINVTGEGITDNADVDPDPFDTSTRVSPLKLYITPPAAEIVKDVESLAAIAFMSFNYEVTLDNVVGESFSTFTGDLNLLGNAQYPVDNLADAIIIAERTGIKTIYVRESMVLDAGVLSNYTIRGRSHVLTFIEIEAALVCDGITVSNANVSGILDGGTHLVDCMVGDLTYVNGHVHNSSLHGTIILASNEDAAFMNCSSIDQDSLPIIDMGVSGQDLAMPNYSGRITIKNWNDPDGEIGIGLDAGMIILEDTVVAGSVIISGNGQFNNSAHEDVYINTDGLINRELITKATWDRVHIDTIDGEAGTAFPLGTLDHPSNNCEDALLIAVANKIKVFDLSSNLTLTCPVSGYTFQGHKNQTLNLNGQACMGTQFYHMTLTGTQLNPIKAENCQLSDLQGLNGSYLECIMGNTIPLTLAASCHILMNNCRSGVPGSDNPILDFSAGDISLNNRAYSGGIRIVNSTDPLNIATNEFIAGKFNFGTDNTEGYFAVRGVVDTTGHDTLATATVSLNGVINSDVILNEPLSGHTVAGTLGGELATKADINAATETHQETADAGSVVYGTETGTYVNTLLRDGTYWQIAEDVVNGLTAEFVFTAPSLTARPGIFSVFGRYIGVPSTTHFIDLDIYNYESAAWETMAEEFMSGGNTSDASYNHEFYQRHIEEGTGEVKARLRHHTTTYNAAHNLYLDYVEAAFIEVTTAQDIATAVWAVPDARKLLNENLHRAVITLDDRHVTIYEEDGVTISHERDISADKRERSLI
jgi:hypothetical protein